MSALSGFLAGLVSFIPTYFAQIMLARAGMRRWPKFRRTFLALLVVPILLEISSMPFWHGKISAPGWIHLIANTWMYISFLSWIVFLVIDKPAEWLERGHKIDHDRRNLIRTAAYTAAAVPAAVLLYGAFIERTAFGVSEVEIKVPNLPPDLEGFRILQISDVHRGAYLSAKELTRVVDMARGLKFDIVLHTGDFISDRHDPLEECINELARVKAPAGAFGCLGNHEVYAGAQKLATRLCAVKDIKILRSQNETLLFGNTKVNLVGVDYEPFFERPRYLESVRSLVQPDAFNILLSHNPDVFPTAARDGFALTFGGHTHGGQVRMEILNQDIDFARIYTPYVSGLYQQDGKSVYVTRGIGTVGVPSRVGAPPEISLIRLSRA